jgi:TDG/mug DNA glycosylase family protein
MGAAMDADAPLSLPDLLGDGLSVLFVGINPSIYSAQRGHYFARPSNRFWPCFSRSKLSLAARQTLGVAELRPEHDRGLLALGFGFTDLVKRATVRASEVEDSEFLTGIAQLEAKLAQHRPRVACFHGMTGYRHVHGVMAGDTSPPVLGLQSLCIADTQLFVVPSPSGANAHFSRAEQTQWYDRLADLLSHG